MYRLKYESKDCLYNVQPIKKKWPHRLKGDDDDLHYNLRTCTEQLDHGHELLFLMFLKLCFNKGSNVLKVPYLGNHLKINMPPF